MNQWAVEGTNEKWTDEYIFCMYCSFICFWSILFGCLMSFSNVSPLKWTMGLFSKTSHLISSHLISLSLSLSSARGCVCARARRACVCMRVYVCASACACVRACVRACVCVAWDFLAIASSWILTSGHQFHRDLGMAVMEWWSIIILHWVDFRSSRRDPRIHCMPYTSPYRLSDKFKKKKRKKKSTIPALKSLSLVLLEYALSPTEYTCKRK